MAFEQVFPVARYAAGTYGPFMFDMSGLTRVTFRLVPDTLPAATSDWQAPGRSVTVLVEQDIGGGWRPWLGPDAYATGDFGKDRSTDPPTLVMPMMSIGDNQALAFRQIRLTVTVAGGAIRVGGEVERV